MRVVRCNTWQYYSYIYSPIWIPMQLLDPMYRNGPLPCFPQLFYATRIYDIIVGC